MIDHNTAHCRRFIRGNVIQRIWRYLTQPKPDAMARLTAAEERALEAKRAAAIKTMGPHWILARNSENKRGWK